MRKDLSKDFIDYYLQTAKLVITKCVEIYPIMDKIEREKLILPDDHPDIIKIASYKDPTGAWYIGILMCHIEDALRVGYSLSLINSLNQVYGCLKSDSEYWPNVWNNDLSSLEAKNLKECFSVVDQLIKKLPQN